jgi:hypothetical protein
MPYDGRQITPSEPRSNSIGGHLQIFNTFRGRLMKPTTASLWLSKPDKGLFAGWSRLMHLSDLLKLMDSTCRI